MNILLAIARTDYGRPGAGKSYEYTSWVAPLARLGHSVDVFDTFAPDWAGDAERTGRELLSQVAATRPDLVLTMLMEREIPTSVIDELRRRKIVIANWFADDTWRFHAYSRHLAPHFTWVVTTSSRAKSRYDLMHGVRAYLRPWGYNSQVFHPIDVPLTADVGFVGQRYGRRARIVEQLRAKGFNVVTRGSGWPEGWIEPEELATQFASTRINLNFLESSAGPFQRLGVRVRGSWRADRLITRVISPPTQLKARPFEITACGAFLLTNSAPELPQFFNTRTEIAVFRGAADLVRQIRHYLSHDDDRSQIAEAGRVRSKEYSWERVLATVLDEAM